MDSRTTASKELVAQIVEELLPDVAVSVQSAVELEERVREVVHELGGLILQTLLQAMERRYPAREVPCGCGGRARFQYRRQAVLITLYGRIRYRRAYYCCPRCHHGHSPLDRQLGLRPGQVSVVLGSLLAMLGNVGAFREAARMAYQLLRVCVSENTIRRQTQRYGAMQEEQEGEWEQESHDSEKLLTRRRTVAEGPKRLYGGLDGVIIPLKDQWMELKVGCWYVAPGGDEISSSREPPTHRAEEISYYCELSDVDGLRPLVWASGYPRDADRAQEVVFIADGASWIWKLVQYHFPEAIQIVDWYHAVAYLAPIAQAVWADAAEGQTWLETAKEHLWHGRVPEVIQACQQYADHPRASEAVHKATTYYGNNAPRMDYARFRAAGYLIGSGVVESACKRIGTQRLKRAGARWSTQGARLTAKARAAWLSHHWDALTRLDLAHARAA